MSLHFNKSVTLFELILAIALLGVMVFGFASVEVFSRQQVITADRRIKTQNESSYVMEHMTQKIRRAIGDVNNPPVILSELIGGDNAIKIWIDYFPYGQRDAADKQIAYAYNAASYEMRYYSNFTDSPSSYEVISRKIRGDFSTTTTQPTYRTYSSANNYIKIQVTASWDPDCSPVSCGTPTNPSAAIAARIMMPSVSTN
jgi:hypothetical protein